MAGSQLKQLKAALKAKGLVGQTNVKKKNKKIAPSETRRDQNEKKAALRQIHSEFNKFDERINRAKHDYTIVQGGKFVKAGSKQHNEASKSHGGMERALKMSYEAEKKMKNRSGGLVDRRFGERNKHLTEEEKMLERFTRERQGLARQGKKSMFSLEESDDEYGDDGLTHSGKTLFDGDDDEAPLGDDFGGYGDESGGALGEAKSFPEQEGPPRKKTKKEVMEEIIAKSKFHKKQRQMEFQKTQEDIMDLDDEFGEVMGEIAQQRMAQPAFSSKTPQDIAYDSRVRELAYDRRAVPADRTKTDEELAKEHEEKMKKLEADRLKRMAGEGDEQRGEGDDLDDFWAPASDDNEVEGSDEENSEEDSDNSAISEDDPEQPDLSSDDEPETSKTSKSSKSAHVTMPEDYESFSQAISPLSREDASLYISKIAEKYHPRLAQGNKEKMDNFVGLLFTHILHLCNENQPNTPLVNELVKTLRSMAEQYNQRLVEVARTETEAVEKRVLAQKLKKQDMAFFALIGYVFSASDHYHLVVTPVVLIMNQFLAIASGQRNPSLQLLAQGLLICDTLLSYQWFAKRFDPEIIRFVEYTLVKLLPELHKLGPLISVRVESSGGLKMSGKEPFGEVSGTPMSVQDGFQEPKNIDLFKVQLVRKAFTTVDSMAMLWRDKLSVAEVLRSLVTLVEHGKRYMPELAELTEKLRRLAGNAEKSRKPLTLQSHRQLAIPTLTPKFEENFNPDKKSYDPNRDRQELNKMRAQIKKEKKGTMKDLRKQSRFAARQQIDEKKKMYGEYHKKMASIVNGISTTEGAEKNLFEREKKRK